MGSLPRPLLAVLVAVIAVFAAWTVVLKPKSSSSGGGAATPQAVHNAITKAVGKSASASNTAAAAKAKPAVHARPAGTAHVSGAQRREDEVARALRAGQVLALLFYNPTAPDDVADTKTLAGIPGHGGEVAKVAVPVSEIARYTSIVNHVAVQSTPSLLVIDRQHAARMLVGYADQLEYDQLVAAALRVK